MSTNVWPRKHGVPIVVTGFEPLDILDGIRRAVVQLEAGRAEVENAYARVVRTRGNQVATEMLADVFEITDRQWRGIGEIPASGLQLRTAYHAFDAERRFGLTTAPLREPTTACRAGAVLQGLIKPNECEAFGSACTPRHPLGAPMVSTEGACAAYHQHRAIQVRPRG